ncbi:hypothetical protein N431DRAFT_453039 [Stipitochalara longipes BDJ]|nr:hypothetical protein N431DRAFT_453039 [Stipitochalara longipes BDJ]
MEELSLSTGSLANGLTTMTTFPKFPKLAPEVQCMIWEFSSIEAEIITVEVVRDIISEKGTKKMKKVNGEYIPRQFSIKYRAFGLPCSLNGTYLTGPDGKKLTRSGQLQACWVSRQIYLRAKPNFLRLFKTGRKIWFNAEIDTISIPRRTRFNLNQLRQRQRPKMVFFTGFEVIKRVVFEEEESEETAIELLGDQIATDFSESIVDIEMEMFEKPNAKFYKDDDWDNAVDLEQVELGKEVKRAKVALAKVNGTVFKEGVNEEVKMLFFPLTKKDLEAQVQVAVEDGQEAGSA